jgi:surfactin synthase thioesterase subunit
MYSQINLICLPFAGGSSYSYSSLEINMPSYINMVPVDLPGRGKRMHEPLVKNAASVVEELYRQICPLIEKPYAIFGHSMGSLLGYLLTRRIIEEKQPAPCHLFFSGRAGPSWPVNDIYYTLPRKDFFSELKKLGGCPEEILQDGELQELFEPVLRADFELVETYTYKSGDPFLIPIDVFYGAQEDLTDPELDCWKNESYLPVTYTSFQGDHFFLLTQPKAVANAIILQLKKYLQ